MKRPYRLVIASALAALAPLAAQAHPGHETHASFVAGALHTASGWDHLTVLLCLGLLAAGRGARVAAGIGALLVLAMTAGAAMGRLFPSAAFVEPAVLATVVASMSLLLLRARIGHAGLVTACLAFMLLHGMAHGQEAPAGDVAGFFAGIGLASALLFAAGVAMANGVRRLRREALESVPVPRLRARLSRRPVRT